MDCIVPVFSHCKNPPAAVQAIREVRIGVPAERRAEIIAFYGDLLGLRAWPAGCQIPGGWGAGDPRRGVYFQYRHDPQIEPMRRRLVLQVASLDALERRLRLREWDCQRQRGLTPCDQCLLLNDPAGHRLEIREFQPL